MTDRIPSFTVTSPHVSILSGIEGIRREKEALRDDVVSKIMEKLDRRGALGRFGQNQMRDILQGFRDEIMNEIGGVRGGRLRRERSRLGFLLGGTSFMHGAA